MVSTSTSPFRSTSCDNVEINNVFAETHLASHRHIRATGSLRAPWNDAGGAMGEIGITYV